MNEKQERDDDDDANIQYENDIDDNEDDIDDFNSKINYNKQIKSTKIVNNNDILIKKDFNSCKCHFQ
jgi:hypothetical protein